MMPTKKLARVSFVLLMAHAAPACAGHKPAASHAPRSDPPPPMGNTDRSEATAGEDTPRPAGASPVAGCWDWIVAEHPLRGRFSFTVEGNALRGTVTLHDEEHPVREGTSSGQRFSLKIAMSGTPVQFEGELNQSDLRGTLTRSGERLSWSAHRCRAAGG